MKDNIISPSGLKGREINKRMIQLMGVKPLTENKSNSSVELTKIGPDGKAYAIIREKHEYFIKIANKTKNLVLEDFNYIGGLQNKRTEVYDSYAKAVKHLSINFKSLAEAYGKTDTFNIFINDNLISESQQGSFIGAHSSKETGFTGQGNLEGNTPLDEETEKDIEMTETEKAIDAMLVDDEEDEEEQDDELLNLKENKLSIIDAITNTDYYDSIMEDIKKKSIVEGHRYTLKIPNNNPEPEPQTQSASEIDDVDNFNPESKPENDNLFNKEPFDAGVDANEDEDPKKFIEQLTGKLGQSLRKYNQSQGSPDFDLEKFAINSLLSATHTSEMDDSDKKDIIKKVNTSGNDQTNNSNQNDGNISNDDNSDFNDEEDLDETFLLSNPKKNNMFQPGSNNHLKEDTKSIQKIFINNLINLEKSRTFGKSYIKGKLKETLNQQAMKNSNSQTEPIAPVKEPVTKPGKENPVKPKRKDSPFLPMPNTNPDPKAIKVENFDDDNESQLIDSWEHYNSFENMIKGIFKTIKENGFTISKKEFIAADINGKFTNEGDNLFTLHLYKDGYDTGEILVILIKRVGRLYDLKLKLK